MITAALFYETEEFIRRNAIVPKLERHAIKVTKQARLTSAYATDYSACDLVILFLSNTSHARLQQVDKWASASGKRVFRITHRTSEKGWQELIKFAQEAPQQDMAVNAPSCIAPPTLTHSLRLMPAPSPSPTPTVATRTVTPTSEWEELATQYSADVERLKVQLATAEEQRKASGALTEREVIRYKGQLARSEAESMGLRDRVLKAEAEAKRLGDELAGARSAITQGAEEAVKGASTARRVERELETTKLTVGEQAKELKKLRVMASGWQESQEATLNQLRETQRQLHDAQAQLARAKTASPTVPPSAPATLSLADHLEALVKSGHLTFTEALNINARSVGTKS